MTTKMHDLVLRIGYLVLGLGGFVLFLFIMNLRSHLYYHGPNYGFLLWIVLYCGITGTGLVQHRRWAAIMLLIPGISLLGVLIYGTYKASAAVPIRWAMVNFIFVGLLIAVPVVLLQKWNRSP